MTSDVEPTKAELRSLFERGAVYADRWSQPVRDALDVSDPLAEEVALALGRGYSVVLAGNAGDGKSHLAARAIDRLSGREILEVPRTGELPKASEPGAILFLRDASALSNHRIGEALTGARQDRLPVLLTINEGPLNELATQDATGLLSSVREALHGRARGIEIGDPAETLVLGLSGRQLTRSGFPLRALETLLPLVSACRTCGRRSKTCPRLIGATQLKKSKTARPRLGLLLQLISDSGVHLTARDIWVFLIDLFFGWTCTQSNDEVANAEGFFWNRVFDGENVASGLIRRQFDPINVSRAVDDGNLWLGNFGGLALTAVFPGTPPVTIARQSEEDGLRSFTNAKRFAFFFSKTWEAEYLLARQAPATQFGLLLERARHNPQQAVAELIGLINHYRIAARTETELWISRHHGLAAHKRPPALAAAGKVPADYLTVRLPFEMDAGRFPEAGFFPDRILFCWKHIQQEFVIDYKTWCQLREERTLTSDREQEILDFALDIFLAQAPLPSVHDPELLIYDHRRRQSTQLRLRSDESRIELL